jgi:hypothetical protein
MREGRHFFSVKIDSVVCGSFLVGIADACRATEVPWESNLQSENATHLCGNGYLMSPQNEALWFGCVVGAQNGGIIGVHVDMDEKIISFDFNYEKCCSGKDSVDVCEIYSRMVLSQSNCDAPIGHFTNILNKIPVHCFF